MIQTYSNNELTALTGLIKEIRPVANPILESIGMPRLGENVSAIDIIKVQSPTTKLQVNADGTISVETSEEDFTDSVKLFTAYAKLIAGTIDYVMKNKDEVVGVAMEILEKRDLI